MANLKKLHQNGCHNIVTLAPVSKKNGRLAMQLVKSVHWLSGLGSLKSHQWLISGQAVNWIVFVCAADWAYWILIFMLWTWLWGASGKWRCICLAEPHCFSLIGCVCKRIYIYIFHLCVCVHLCTCGWGHGYLKTRACLYFSLVIREHQEKRMVWTQESSQQFN